MATIRKEITTTASSVETWDALRDIGQLHTRLVRGFVTDTRLDPDARVVTFANGMVARERIVTVDDQARRLVWSATGPILSHHNGSAQVLTGDDGSTRVVWMADILPDSAAATVDLMMEQGMVAMKATLDSL